MDHRGDAFVRVAARRGRQYFLGRLVGRFGRLFCSTPLGVGGHYLGRLFRGLQQRRPSYHILFYSLGGVRDLGEYFYVYSCIDFPRPQDSMDVGFSIAFSCGQLIVIGRHRPITGVPSPRDHINELTHSTSYQGGVTLTIGLGAKQVGGRSIGSIGRNVTRF